MLGTRNARRRPAIEPTTVECGWLGRDTNRADSTWTARGEADEQRRANWTGLDWTEAGGRRRPAIRGERSCT